MFTSKNNPSRNDAKANEAVRLYNSGLSHSQIAKIMNCSRQSIHDMCRLRPDYIPRTKTPAECQYFNGVKYTKRNNGYFLSTQKKRQLMHRDVWEYHNGKIPESYDIHHIDHNRANNNIENLQMLSKSDHARIYSNENNQFSKRAV